MNLHIPRLTALTATRSDSDSNNLAIKYHPERHHMSSLTEPVRKLFDSSAGLFLNLETLNLQIPSWRSNRQGYRSEESGEDEGDEGRNCLHLAHAILGMGGLFAFRCTKY